MEVGPGRLGSYNEQPCKDAQTCPCGSRTGSALYPVLLPHVLSNCKRSFAQEVAPDFTVDDLRQQAQRVPRPFSAVSEYCGSLLWILIITHMAVYQVYREVLILEHPRFSSSPGTQ